MRILNNIVQHYQKDDEKFIKQIFHLLEMIDENQSIYYFGFINPHEQEIISSLVSHFNSQVIFEGKTFERKYAIFISEAYVNIELQSNIGYVQLSYNNKFNKVKHSQVMGTIYNLGINERKIGDIIVDKDANCEVVVEKEFIETLRLMLNQVGKQKVQVKEISEINILPKPMDQKIKSSKSLRVDIVVKNLYNLSRSEVKKKIQKQEVVLNYEVVKDGKKEIVEGDLISVKRYGRRKVENIKGKNDKYNITYLQS